MNNHHDDHPNDSLVAGGASHTTSEPVVGASRAASESSGGESVGGRAVKHQARRQFDAWAHTYDRSIVQHLLFQPAYQLLLEELHRWRRDDPTPFRMLDIGSGTGSWAAMVCGANMAVETIIGLDYSNRMCRFATEKALRAEASKVVFIRGDAERLPFADACFDVVTCSHSFHHYPHQAPTVREMRRVLRHGGRLMLLDGFRDNVIGWFVYDVIITRGESTADGMVFHAPWSQMRRYFEEAGFGDVRQRKVGIWTPLLLTIGAV